MWPNIAPYQRNGRTASIVIAAYNSSPQAKKAADYVCDGVDDHIEIQAAIDSLRRKFGSIFLCDGRYNIANTVVLYAGIALISSMPGWALTPTIPSVGAVIYSNVNMPILQVRLDPDFTAANWFPYIENLHIKGSNNGAYTNQHGIYIAPPADAALFDVHLINCMVNETGGDGFHIDCGTKLWIERGYAENCRGNGLYIRSSGGGYIKGMYIYRNGVTSGANIKLVDTGSGGFIISGNHIRQRGSIGDIQTYSAGRVAIITGNAFYGDGTSTGPAIDLQTNDQDKYIVITSNHFYNYVNGVKISKGNYWSTGKTPYVIVGDNIFNTVTNKIYSPDFILTDPNFKIHDNIELP